MKLADAARSLTTLDAVRLVREALDLAARFETRGLAWRPTPADFGIDDDTGKLVLIERRGVFPLEYPSRFDVEPVLTALGASLVPTPLAIAPPSLVRLLLPQRATSKTGRSVEDARRAIDAIDLATPAPAPSAALSDIGLWRERNDDVALVASGGARDNAVWHALVVCDGVSSVSHAGGAAAVAARSARDEIVRGAPTASEPAHIVGIAVRAADLAVRRLAAEVRSAVGTTIVAALIRGDEVAVAWVGDSRAYLVTDRGEEQMTVDHALDRELTSCLGMVDADGNDAAVRVDVVTRQLGREGTVILCSDGLWNYFPSASSIARLTRNVQNTHKNAVISARFLVSSALAVGGADNVSVALHRRGG